MKTYKIKPLRWKKGVTPEYSQHYETHNAFGYFYVRRWWDDEKHKWGPWQWGYYFDDYYDEAEHECHSLKAGKEAATAEWHKRLSGALEEVT